jgi:hypothetical protein
LYAALQLLGLARRSLSLDGKDLIRSRRCGDRALFGMRDDVHNHVPVILDEEIKAPILVDASLSEALTLVIFLGAERGVMEIVK